MKEIFKKLKSLDKGTILRSILMVLTLVNQLIALLGQTSFASATWYQVLSFMCTLSMMIVSYWYNNDWTKLAQTARDIFDAMKDGKISEEEAKKLLEKKEKSK